MALAEEVKKGGPYTKKEQDERRKEVYRLHFEFGYSAVKIADLMKINRNTINTDINFLYSQLSKQWKGYDTNSLIIKQVQRLELQRSRLYEELDKQEKSSDKLIIEKLLFQIDNRLIQIYSKILPRVEVFEPPSYDIKITDHNVKNFVKKFLKKQSFGTNLSFNDLKFEIIKLTKREPEYADALYNKMCELGLDVCRDHVDPLGLVDSKFDIKKFALMRGYIADNDLSNK